MSDPILAHLLADLERAQAALRDYLLGEETADLVPLAQAAIEFRRSNDTVRRWADDEGLGRKIGGRWYLSRSEVRKLKRA